MSRYELRLKPGSEPFGETPDEDLSLETPSLPLALIVADINMQGGRAEIWQGGKRIARIKKRLGARKAFWEVS